jgi:SOS response regulatory protein OraA/RecX
MKDMYSKKEVVELFNDWNKRRTNCNPILQDFLKEKGLIEDKTYNEKEVKSMIREALQCYKFSEAEDKKEEMPFIGEIAKVSPLTEDEAKSLMKNVSIKDYALCHSIAIDLSCRGFNYEMIETVINKVTLRNGETYIKK